MMSDKQRKEAAMAKLMFHCFTEEGDPARGMTPEDYHNVTIGDDLYAFNTEWILDMEDLESLREMLDAEDVTIEPDIGEDPDDYSLHVYSLHVSYHNVKTWPWDQ